MHALLSSASISASSVARSASTTGSLLKGREVALRKRIADAMFEVVRKEFSISYASGELAVTLEVREMDAQTYRK